MNRPAVKICGVGDAVSRDAAIAGGAACIGFVFYPPSPRSLGPERAARLADGVPPGVRRVGVVVNPDDAWLDRIMAIASPDMLQLHGSESPERVAAIRHRLGVPVIKAIAVAATGDLDRAAAFVGVADMLLFDSRPPPGPGVWPGGNATGFDWSLLAGRHWPCPWWLAGGLHAGNVAAAMDVSGARRLDVSSGVESAPGRKDPALIQRFLDTVARHGEAAS